jgi:hypothetical protein
MSMTFVPLHSHFVAEVRDMRRTTVPDPASIHERDCGELPEAA